MSACYSSAVNHHWTIDEQSRAEHYRRFAAEEIDFCLGALNYGLKIDFPPKVSS
jgi:hypothetical protein